MVVGLKIFSQKGNREDGGKRAGGGGLCCVIPSGEGRILRTFCWS